MLKRKPNLLIVGAAKSGTTTLYNVLKSHPMVYMSPIKEVHYFSKDIDVNKFSKEYRQTIELNPQRRVEKWEFSGVFSTHIQNSKLYYSLFSKATSKHKFIGEVSPSYLYSKVAAKNIKKELGEPKIIMILRNPIERAFSHYLMDVRIGYTKDTFINLINRELSLSENHWGRDTQYIGLGMYFNQVKRYIDIFPKDKILILYHDDLKEDFNKTIFKMLDFLGLNSNEIKKSTYNKAELPRNKYINYLLRKSGIRNIIGKLLNENVKNKFKRYYYTYSNLPNLTMEERELLRNIFIEDINNLSDLLKKDFSYWL